MAHLTGCSRGEKRGGSGAAVLMTILSTYMTVQAKRASQGLIGQAERIRGKN